MNPRVERSRAAGLAAARSILLEEGWEAVSQAHVAERAEISRATVYRHWPDRADLLLEVISPQVASIHAEPTGDLRRDLKGELERFTAAVNEPGWTTVTGALVHHANTDPKIRALLDHLTESTLEPIRNAIERAVLSGELRPDTNPELGSAELMGPLFFRYLIQRLPEPPGFLDSIVDQYVDAHQAAPQRRRVNAIR